MPTKVLGEDGREIAEKLGEMDAMELAHNVHANTGETLSLVPYVEKGDGWVLDESAAVLFPAADPPAEEKPKRSRKKAK